MPSVELPLSDGGVTLVDSYVAEILRDKKLHKRDKQGYVRFSQGKKEIYLHRMIMKPGKGMVVDHLNGDTLDNRRENLRVCTFGQNRQNRRAVTRSISGFRNVFWASDRNQWRIIFKNKKKRFYIGQYHSKYIAGIFSDQALVERVGTFVSKNFTEKITISCLSEFFDGTNGKIFKVVFSRRSDGVQREMLCRIGVNSRHNGGKIPFDPKSLGLYSVYDVQKKSYRFIPLENVICIRFAKTNYRIVD